jgi:hypothetical protein
MNSKARAAINRQNAQHSTGPVTADGKQASSMNATRHGITAQHMILQPREQEALLRLQEGFMRDLRPKTGLECDLVLKIVDCSIRLSRISTIENNILNLSTLENLRSEDAQDPLMEFAIAQSRAYLERANEIEKLSRYQSRISRQMIQYTKELSRLQKERRQQADERFLASKSSGKPTQHTKAASARETAENTDTNADLASFRQAASTAVSTGSKPIPAAVSQPRTGQKMAA